MISGDFERSIRAASSVGGQRKLWARRARALLLSSLLLCSPLFANDTSVGGTGVDLYSLKESSIHMKAEDISLTHSEGSFRIVAHYTFENPTEKDVKLQVGFPEVGCPKDEESNCHAKAFRGLETKVDGTSVTHRKGSLKQTEHWAEHLGTFWLFDVEFPAKKKVTIVHRYSMDAALDSMGGVSVNYVTRTGTTWAKPIAHARFRFRVPPYATYLRWNEVLGTPKNPRFVKDGAEAFTEVTFEKENWTPSGDLYFSFATAFGQFPVPRLDPDRLAQHAQELSLSSTDLCPWKSRFPDHEPETKAQAQSCRNLIYARWGYPFEKKELRDLYYSGAKDWHISRDYGPNSLLRDPAPLPEFSMSWTSHTERKLLKEITFKGDVTDLPKAQELAQAVTPPTGEMNGAPKETKISTGALGTAKQEGSQPAHAKSGCSFVSGAKRGPLAGTFILVLAGVLVFMRKRSALSALGGILANGSQRGQNCLANASWRRN